MENPRVAPLALALLVISGVAHATPSYPRSPAKYFAARAELKAALRRAPFRERLRHAGRYLRYGAEHAATGAAFGGAFGGTIVNAASGSATAGLVIGAVAAVTVGYGNLMAAASTGRSGAFGHLVREETARGLKHAGIVDRATVQRWEEAEILSRTATPPKSWAHVDDLYAPRPSPARAR
jgi:hypothetical protein